MKQVACYFSELSSRMKYIVLFLFSIFFFVRLFVLFKSNISYLSARQNIQLKISVVKNFKEILNAEFCIKLNIIVYNNFCLDF